MKISNLNNGQEIKNEWYDFTKQAYIDTKPEYVQKYESVKSTLKVALKPNWTKISVLVTISFFVLMFANIVHAQPTQNAVESIVITETSIIPSATETIATTPITQYLQEPEWLTPLITRESNRTGVPANVLSALIGLESAGTYDPKIQGDYIDGAYRSFGLGQIYIELHGVTYEQATNPEFAVAWIADHLNGKFNKWGTWYQALQAYNGGDGAIYGSYSHNYADTICRRAGLY